MFTTFGNGSRTRAFPAVCNDHREVGAFVFRVYVTGLSRSMDFKAVRMVGSFLHTSGLL